MPVKPEFAEYFRTMVRREHTANEAIEATLDRDGWDGFPRYAAALFYLCVDRRFGDSASKREIIEFVAQMRAGLSEEGPAVDAEAAETLIGSILEPVEYRIPQEMIGRIQAATIYQVLTDEPVSEAELDLLLREAGRLADLD